MTLVKVIRSNCRDEMVVAAFNIRRFPKFIEEMDTISGAELFDPPDKIS